MSSKWGRNEKRHPALAVFSRNGKFVRFVAFLHAPSHGLGMTHGLRLGFSFRFGYGLSFCSANFCKERLGFGRSRHLAQQQSPSCDFRSVDRVPAVTVLADRCTLQGEARLRRWPELSLRMVNALAGSVCAVGPKRSLREPSIGRNPGTAPMPIANGGVCLRFISISSLNQTYAASTPSCLNDQELVPTNCAPNSVYGICRRLQSLHFHLGSRWQTNAC